MKRMHPMLIAAALAVFVTPALADVPMLLNYQGRLTDPSGNPKNGTFTMQFAVYDAETGDNQQSAPDVFGGSLVGSSPSGRGQVRG